jgi:hypothetical protein
MHPFVPSAFKSIYKFINPKCAKLFAGLDDETCLNPKLDYIEAYHGHQNTSLAERANSEKYWDNYIQ